MNADDTDDDAPEPMPPDVEDRLYREILESLEARAYELQAARVGDDRPEPPADDYPW